MANNVVVVVNAKGGSGGSTLCVEMARMSAKLGRRTALVDADLNGRRSIATLMDLLKPLAAGRSVDVYSSASAGNVDVVELADSFENSFSLRQDAIDRMVGKLTDTHDIVFADVPAPFLEPVKPLMARLDRLVVVTESSVLGLTAGRSLVIDLTKLGVPLQRISLIVNNRGSRSDVSSRDIERNLSVSVIGEVPQLTDRNAGRALESLVKAVAVRLEDAPALSLRSFVGNRTMSSGGPVVEAVVAKTPEETREDQASRERRIFLSRVRVEIMKTIRDKFDSVIASRAHTDGEKVQELRVQIANAADAALNERTDVSKDERALLQQEIIDETLGLGPLEELMRDEKVSEIMINGPERIYVERGGQLTLSSRQFENEAHLRQIIDRIITPIGRRVDESSPMVDARLQDGSRVNAIINPLALDGSSMTIRRFSKRRLGIQDLVNFGSIAPESVSFLRAMVQGRLNIVVSGGTGSGKTTFLNILSGFIPENERIVTIEDAAELSLSQDHVVRLESRPANLEGKGAITIRDLVKNSLRMRPDRIIVGECRSGEALDMLQAMNTGHDGSLTTLHANTPRDALARLETLVLMAGFDLPIKAIREQISAAVHGIVQIQRLSDGSRKCTSISEVVGMEGDIVTMQEIVCYKQKGTDDTGKVIGEFQFTGVNPHYAPLFADHGVDFDVRDLSRMKTAAAAW